MGIEFTPQQREVIELHGCNILVSAAAGSGKTAVLVERIIRMICDEGHPVDIDRLLIVTFTKAAAAEMRERIRAGIARRLAENPESEHIQRQSTLLHNAQITTVHSFCSFLIRNHFNEIGLDPAFRVADEGEMKLLQGDVLEELMEDSFAREDEAFRYCVEYFCPGGRETQLEQYILELHRFAASFPWPGEWLEERKSDYPPRDGKPVALGRESENRKEAGWQRYLLSHLRSMAEGCAERLRQVRSVCEEPDGPYMYGELVDRELEQIETLTQLDTLEAFAERLPAVSFGRLPSKKDDTVSPGKREAAKELRSRVKDTVSDMAARFFATPLALAADQAARCSAPVVTLVELVLEFGRKLQEKKQERKVLDFSDMEHFALDILWKRQPASPADGELSQECGADVRPSDVALEYRRYFEEVLVDEYQDSNLVQEFLLRAVSGEDDGRCNRFMVGDVKQSIYKFRLAKPELFLEKYDTYEQGRGDRRRIDLSMNFRSRREVVDTVNGVFSGIMSRQIGGINYDDRAALYAGAVYPENPGCQSELLLIEKPGKEAGVGPKQAESLAIAQKIKELRRSFLVTDRESGEPRPVRYSDMVILLRTNSGWDEEFKRTLEEEGIPVYITSKTGYFAAPEVQELLQILRVLNNPRQDIPLFGAMRSVFGGFSEEELARMRSGVKGKRLYDALKAWAAGAVRPNGEAGAGNAAGLPESAGAVETFRAGHDLDSEAAALSRKAAEFLEKLEKYRGYTVYMPVRELLQRVIDDHGYLHYAAALPAGGKRKANVEMLLTKASDFEKTSYFGLFHFIRYIEELERYDVDFGEALLLDENADVVRIMSIHKSKGLEFPVTFVAGLAKHFNMQDANRSLIVDSELGIGADYVDPVRRVRNKTLRRAALARKMREDSLSEELRVLYVALTRAKEKLILSGTLDKAAEKWERLQENGAGGSLSYCDFMEAGSCLDFLLPVIGNAHVETTVLDMAALAGTQAREQVQLSERKLSLRSAGKYADQEALRLLLDRFSYRYPYEALEKLYTKTTVSELKIAAMAEKDEAAFHAFEEREVVPYIPAFRREKEEISGTVRGNAYHKVMELMDFSMVYRGMREPEREAAFDDGLDGKLLRDNLHELLDREEAEGRLTGEFRQALDERKLLRFLGADIARRMRRAQETGRLRREQPFVYGVSARRLGEQFPEEETVLVQGIIDVFFEEEDGLVLLDYKTDVIRSPEELWNRYEAQLGYYEEALRALTGKKVKEKILYSFYLERTVQGGGD